MYKGAPADKGPMIPKYSNPRIKAAGASPHCGCDTPRKNPHKGSGMSASKLHSYAHSRKGRTNGH